MKFKKTEEEKKLRVKIKSADSAKAENKMRDYGRK